MEKLGNPAAWVKKFLVFLPGLQSVQPLFPRLVSVGAWVWTAHQRLCQGRSSLAKLLLKKDTV